MKGPVHGRTSRGGEYRDYGRWRSQRRPQGSRWVALDRDDRAGAVEYQIERFLELLAIVTSSPPEWIDLVCDRFELTGFDAIVSAEEVNGPGKPEPHVYRHAADELGVDPAECVAVEDSTHGVASATAAGMTCIGYRGADAKDSDLAAADIIVDDPQELRAALLAR